MATASRADLHCHSTASQVSKLGVQRALGLPECATPPQEVYELAKRRGMDFVTITDHDTIAGGLELIEREDCFLSEELTAWFRGEAQAVHVLCWGITPDDHAWLQRNARDVEKCATYLHEHEITCALAHPFYAVAAPLTSGHRRRLGELFPVWETRNGSRALELNLPAALYADTRGGVGVGGSDDHAGVDIGRTFTQTPPAETPAEFLAFIRAGEAVPGGHHGSAAKWAHAAMALATRALGPGAGAADPQSVLVMLERVMREGDARHGATGEDLRPEHARGLLRTWLEAIGFQESESELLAMLQSPSFTHAGLYRHARHAHERKLVGAVGEARAAITAGGDLGAAATTLFEACVPAIPYVAATAFLASEKAKVTNRDGEVPRVALVADGLEAMHGVTHTLDEIRARGIPGFEVDVIGTDSAVDRRLPAVTELDMPLYDGLKLGVPSVSRLVEAIADGVYDAVHLCTPGPAGAGAALAARLMGLPRVGSYHTELATYANLRSGDPRLGAAMQMALAVFYGQCDMVLSPSGASDASLQTLGIPADRIERWTRGVDIDRFDPDKRVTGLFPGEINVLYAGRQTREKGVELLADAFLAARHQLPGLHLVLAGGGPEEQLLRERVGNHATFLGWLEGEELARAYASADLLLFPSRTDTFGQVIIEAQASGLPVVAVAEGGPAELVRSGETGTLCPPFAEALASAVLALASSPRRRSEMGARARHAVRERSWDAALAQLAAGYRRAVGTTAPVEVIRAA